jgi:hypothetical protein
LRQDLTPTQPIQYVLGALSPGVEAAGTWNSIYCRGLEWWRFTNTLALATSEIFGFVSSQDQWQRFSFLSLDTSITYVSSRGAFYWGVTRAINSLSGPPSHTLAWNWPH